MPPKLPSTSSDIPQGSTSDLNVMTTNFNIPLPSKMELQGDQAANWSFFKEEWNDYEIASGLDQQDDKKRVATFKVALGRETRQILTNLKLEQSKTKQVSTIIKELDLWFTPKLNVIYERFVFGTAIQEENEPVETFISRLRKLASICEYKTFEGEMIRDRLVIGIRSEATKKRCKVLVTWVYYSFGLIDRYGIITLDFGFAHAQ